MKVQVQEVNIQKVTKGKNSYSVAEATYTTERGENKVKKVMSFSNPAVFEVLSKISHPTWVETEHDGAPYYNWTSINVVADEPAVSTPKAGAVAAKSVSTYETADERKVKQLYIIRQSSISNAIEYLNATAGAAWGTERVLEVAQEFVDFVYGTQEILGPLDPTD